MAKENNILKMDPNEGPDGGSSEGTYMPCLKWKVFALMFVAVVRKGGVLLRIFDRKRS